MEEAAFLDQPLWHLRPFTPKQFIRIDSNGGNIGRFYWCNQLTLSIEVWDNSRDPFKLGAPSWWKHCPTEVNSSEITGASSLIFNLGDWWNWVLT